VIHSSAAHGWQGFLVEKHVCSPGERLPAVTDRHVISLLCGRPARFDYGSAGIRCGLSFESPGSMTIIPTGHVPGVRLHDAAEFTHCALDDEFIRGIGSEMESRPSGKPVFRVGVRDTGIQRILDLLIQELQADAPTGRLYVGSLAFALATRYLLCGIECEATPKSQVSPLPQRILNRVREKIEGSLDTDISLEVLAEESGYSRAHFLRMFREATGMTPHQYVLDVRLRHAQEWLRKKNAALIDIAAVCGFSSQSHMTSVFRKRLGVTPGEFRRTA
jgi:AraC family transcriptional regulator